MSDPKVSIVIPVYNGADYLGDAIESALAQTYSNLEIIVVNDGSRDAGATEAIAKAYGDKIRYIFQPNGGVAKALNTGIEHMRGDYFSWLSHDDMYMPEKVAQEVALVRTQADATTIVAEGIQVVDAAGKYLYTVDLYDRYSEEELSRPLFALLRGGINGCAMLIHRSHFARVGLFDTTLPTTQDFDLWFRMLRGQRLCYAHSANTLSRAHAAQGSKARLEAHIEECDALWIRMMENLTDAERVQLDGSPRQFYENQWAFLQEKTGYARAMGYAWRKAMDYRLEEYAQAPTQKRLGALCGEYGIVDRDELEKIMQLRAQKDDRARLLFLTNKRANRGGQDRMQINLMECLCPRYDVIFLSEGCDLDKAISIDARIRELHMPAAMGNPAHIPVIAAMLRVDVLVISYNCIAKYLDLYPICRAYGISTVAWNHEDFFLPYWRKALHGCLPQRLASLAAADVCLWINAYAYGMYRASRVNNAAYIPDFFTKPVRLAQAGGDRPRNLVAAGRFDDARKGLEPLLRAFAFALKQVPDAKLYVLGAYDLQAPIPSNASVSYGALVRNLRIPKENLCWVPWTDDIDAYYKSCRANVLLSCYEGFGLTLLEAAAVGTPSIVFGGSGMDDIIRDGENGYVVPRGDVLAAAEKMVCLLRDDELATTMSQRACAMAQRFSPAQVVPRWEALLEGLLRMDKTAFVAFLRERYAAATDPEQLLGMAVREYEACIGGLIQDASQGKGNNYANSVFWKMTKPLRAWRYAIETRDSWRTGLRGYFMYMADTEGDKLTDEQILRSRSWKLTAPLRVIVKGCRSVLRTVAKR